jgi:hypothetical protein
MEFASEMVAKAALAGLRIEEVPTDLRPDGRAARRTCAPGAMAGATCASCCCSARAGCSSIRASRCWRCGGFVVAAARHAGVRLPGLDIHSLLYMAGDHHPSGPS